MMRIYTVYFDLPEFPKKYVGVETVTGPTGDTCRGDIAADDHLSCVRKWIIDSGLRKGGMCCAPMQRHPDDDKHIVEVWI